jgi:tetratricopeptide (TPR) repeat protein
MKSPRAMAGALALAMAALFSRPAAAEPNPDALVAKARRAMVDLDFERAIRLLGRAEGAGKSGREQLVVIYRALAESRAALGEADAAEAEFRRLLSLDPEAALPPGSSPKLTAPFEAARSFMSQRKPLQATCVRGDDRALLSIVSDPTGLVASGRLLAQGGSTLARARKAGRTRFPLTLPAGAPAELTCALFDRHGNELARMPLLTEARLAAIEEGDEDPSGILAPGDDPTPPAAPATPRAEPGGRSAPAAAPTSSIDRGAEPESPPIYARWWLWGSAALVAAGATGYFAVQLQADEDDWRAIKRTSQEHTYAEALEVQERGERNARYGNIALGATAALAAVSVGLLVRDVVRRRRDESHASVGAAPLPGGAAASVRVSF